MRVVVRAGEPIVFTRKTRATSTPILIRGLLELEVSEPTPITSISASLICKWRVEWPGGIPPTFNKFHEEKAVVSSQDLLLSDKVQALQQKSSVEGRRSRSGVLPSRQDRGTVVSRLFKGWARSASALPVHDNNNSNATSTLIPPGKFKCPFGFALPHDTAPTIRVAGRARCSFQLKVEIRRPGLFIPTATASCPLQIVLLPEVDTLLTNESGEGELLEYNWKDHLRLNLCVGNRHFMIGGYMPLYIFLIPLRQLAIHQILVVLEEIGESLRRRIVPVSNPTKSITVLFQTQDGTVQDREKATHTLFTLRQKNRHIPLLPIPPSSSDETLNTLRKYSDPKGANAHHPVDHKLSDQLKSPNGPWDLKYSVPIPGPSSSLRFSFDHRPHFVFQIEHRLRISITVGTSNVDVTDPAYSSSAGLNDIEHILPVQILSVSLFSQCGPEWTKLPSYIEVSNPNTTDPYDFILNMKKATSTLRSDEEFGTSSAAATSGPSPNEWDITLRRDASPSHGRIRRSLPPGNGGSPNQTFEALRTFTALVGGRQSVDGRSAPRYDG
ncbi:uncharacterized protein EI90DRAFT_3122350 [Cantharellus anzutake]|uniref:uncharacterized protein n=1 Tax=Cantharellus anzutake TaxID=1750568 RepID=UPI0019044B48|nr:uncharacterized protein EI90DRAFT_3122350 [Cantharellus anzutake]KAF8332595.1 hypothetical protein EI90DRAFT_3122350 [Cantharellus anzutake]